MKPLVFLASVAMVCATIIFVSTRQPARAATLSVNINGATFTDLPLVQSHSAAMRLNTPIETSLFSGGTVRVVESQMPIEAGLVLTHVSAQTEGSYGDYYVFIDGELVFLGGLSYSTASIVTQPMSPILVRPGRLLRIEFRTSNNALPLVNLQGFAVSNGALYQ